MRRLLNYFAFIFFLIFTLPNFVFAQSDGSAAGVFLCSWDYSANNNSTSTFGLCVGSELEMCTAGFTYDDAFCGTALTPEDCVNLAPNGRACISALPDGLESVFQCISGSCTPANVSPEDMANNPSIYFVDPNVCTTACTTSVTSCTLTRSCTSNGVVGTQICNGVENDSGSCDVNESSCTICETPESCGDGTCSSSEYSSGSCNEDCEEFTNPAVGLRLDLCKQAGSLRGACEVCMGVEGSRPGLWTAFGCINTGPANSADPSAITDSIASSFFRVALGVSGGAALLLILYGSFNMSTSSGDPERLKKAQETITSSIIGLVFIILSAVILRFIGLDLLQLPSF